MPLPPDPRVALDLANAPWALDYYRAHADPRTPLLAYVFGESGRAAARAEREVPWSEIGSPRVIDTTAGSYLTMGWCSRDDLARAVSLIAPSEAASVRALPASDVGLWSLVHFGDTITVVRIGAEELMAVDTDALEARVAALPKVKTVRTPPEGDPAWGGLVVHHCGSRSCADGGEHDDAGPPMVSFHARGSLASWEGTCSKCGRCAMEDALWG